jgi:hypothetical protein
MIAASSHGCIRKAKIRPGNDGGVRVGVVFGLFHTLRGVAFGLCPSFAAVRRLLISCDKLRSVFQDGLSQFCNIFGRGSCRWSPRTPVIAG